MVIAGIPHEELRPTRAAQEWLADALLDFDAPTDLATWLAANTECCSRNDPLALTAQGFLPLPTL